MKKLVSTFYDIRETEWRPVLLMFGLHFLLMVTLYFLKPARDSLFLTSNGPNELPYVYLLLAAISMPVASFLTYVIRKYNVRPVLLWTLGILILNILIIRWLFQFNQQWIYLAFYLWVGIFGILVISLYWLLANAVFKPSQSKRIFSFLTLGAILGAITGSEMSNLAVSLLDITTPNLLYLCAVSLTTAFLILFFIPETSSRPEENEYRNDGSKSDSGSALQASRKILSSPYQRKITAMIGLTMIATTFTDYQYKAIAFEAYPLTANLTSFMGTFYAGISLASLGIQTLLSSQIIKKTGLLGAVLARPVGMSIGAVLMAIEPVLASVVILNGMDSATRYSIDKTGRELLFLPLSKHSKDQSKLFIDIFVDRFTRGFGGLLLLGLIYAFADPVYPLTYLLIFVLGLWIYLGTQAQKGYVEKFRNSVQKQLISTGSIALNLNEPSIHSIISDSLQCNKDSQILHTLFLLEETDVTKINDELRALLHHRNREIRLQSLKLLQHANDLDLSGEVEQLLSDEDPEIRLETIYYLCQHSRENPEQVIKSYLVHDDHKLRSAALGCASKHGGSATELVDPDFFDELLNNESKDAVVIKSQIADALGYIDDEKLTRKYLIRLLHDEHPTVVRKAIASMGRQQSDRFIPMLIKKLDTPDFKLDIRKTLAAYGTEYLILYKDRFFDDDLGKNIRKALPGIFSQQPEQSSIEHLFDMLKVEDTNLRYHVIKALNKLRREHQELAMDQSQVRRVIQHEAYNYFKLLAIKLLQPVDHPNEILLKALDEKMNQSTERIFRLLGLIYDPSDMYGTYLALRSLSAEKRSAAVEFLDNILADADKKYIMPITDERTNRERLEAGQQLFSIPDMKYDEGLMQLIEGEDHWLHVCAIYSVSPQCPDTLQSKVEEATYASDELLRETAVKVMERNTSKSK